MAPCSELPHCGRGTGQQLHTAYCAGPSGGTFVHLPLNELRGSLHVAGHAHFWAIASSGIGVVRTSRHVASTSRAGPTTVRSGLSRLGGWTSLAPCACIPCSNWLWLTVKSQPKRKLHCAGRGLHPPGWASGLVFEPDHSARRPVVGCAIGGGEGIGGVTLALKPRTTKGGVRQHARLRSGPSAQPAALSTTRA
jgi:hypothetical protein